MFWAFLFYGNNFFIKDILKNTENFKKYIIWIISF